MKHPKRCEYNNEDEDKSPKTLRVKKSVFYHADK